MKQLTTQAKKILFAKSLLDSGISIIQLQDQLKEKFGSGMNLEKLRFIVSDTEEANLYIEELKSIIINTSENNINYNIELINYLNFFLKFFLKMQSSLDINQITENDLQTIEAIEKLIKEEQ